MIELTLPWPPSINHYYGHGKPYYRYVKTKDGRLSKKLISGPKYLAKAGRIFRQEVVYICKQHKVKKLEGPLRMSITWYPPDRRKRDIDNYDKALLDALKYGGCYVDDSQIKERNAVMGEYLLGRVDVRIEPAPDVMVCKPGDN